MIKRLPLWVLFLVGLFLWIGVFSIRQALPLPGQPLGITSWATRQQEQQFEIANSEAKKDDESGLEAFDEVVKDSQKLEGLFTLYHNQEKNHIYLELKPEQLNRNYLCLVTLSTGIGEGWLLSGMPLDDFLFRFRRQQDKVQFVVPNVKFRTRPGSPSQRSLDRSFSDSVLYSLKIKSIHPQRETLLIDLADLLLKPGLSRLNQALPLLLGAPYYQNQENSYFGKSKAFEKNLEVEAIYGFSANEDSIELPSLPDSRAFSLSVNYSLSELPANNTYVPRLADDRLGYFVTAYKDFSNGNSSEPFVRYINRWHLEPQDSHVPLSPPQEPIVFWLENTIPLEYRSAVAEGVLMWNKAFEKAGFKDAIQVKQMPDNADWDPADVRYNTIRWSSSFQPSFFGIGPSRVNPLTGQILDADIIIDANVVQFVKGQYRDLLEPHQAQLTTSPIANFCDSNLINQHDVALETQTTQAENYSLLSPLTQTVQKQVPSFLSQLMEKHDLCYGSVAARQLSIGAMALSLLPDASANGIGKEEYVKQFLVSLIGHEVGHTLGLRHNFHGSTMLPPAELNDVNITRSQGMVGSIMDYVAVNLAPPDVEQGDYYPRIVGPYDSWAIEYGYKVSGAIHPTAERSFLEDIAQKAAQPELAYGTDEDFFGFLDPEVNPFDLSSDVLLYAQWQMDNAQAMWERLNKRYPIQGDTYSEMRQKFNTVLIYYLQQALLVSNYIGGQSFNRDRPGDPNGRPPFQAVSLEKQREALTKIQKYIFDKDAFNFPAELLNQLAPSRWNHWGHPAPLFSLDYPIHDNILFLQRIMLRTLMSNGRLARLRDLELKAESGQALTLPELFDTLQAGIWTEVLQPNEAQPNISSIRRSLQREHLEILSDMVLRRVPAPEDARTLAWYQLRQLGEDLTKTLRKQSDQLNTYTKAHLEESRDRLFKTLEARLQSN